MWRLVVGALSNNVRFYEVVSTILRIPCNVFLSWSVHVNSIVIGVSVDSMLSL